MIQAMQGRRSKSKGSKVNFKNIQGKRTNEGEGEKK